MARVKGSRVGSVDKLKKELKSAKSGGAIKGIKADTELQVRFLAEIPDWFNYREHYDAGEKRFYPCIDEDCPGCAEDNYPSSKHLAPVLDVAEGTVYALKLPKTVVESLVKKYDKFKTLMDRDYYITREGSGKNDTRYDVTPESPSRRNTRKFEVPDLEDLVNGLLDDDDADSEEELDAAIPLKGKRRTASPKPGGVKRRRPVADDDDEDEDDTPPWNDDEDDDEDEKPVVRRRRTSPPPKKAVTRTVARKAPRRKSL